jgi:uncharacterized protein YuzE
MQEQLVRRRLMATKVTYDPGADVLYVRFDDKAAEHGVEDGHGRVWRFGRDNKLIGVTFLDFTSRLMENKMFGSPR